MAWDNAIITYGTKLPSGTLQKLNLTHGCTLAENLPVHRQMGTTFQLAHHTALALTGERH